MCRTLRGSGASGLNPSVEAGKVSAPIRGGGGGLPTVNSPPRVPAVSSLDQEEPRCRCTSTSTGSSERQSHDTAALRRSPAEENRDTVRVRRSSRRRPGGAILRGKRSILPDCVPRPGSPGGGEPCGVVRLGAVGFPACFFFFFGGARYCRAHRHAARLSLSLSLSLFPSVK